MAFQKVMSFFTNGMKSILKKILVNNLPTAYLDEGEGSVILMLHGWRRTLSDFDGIATILKNNYRIIRIDLPGFGETEKSSQAWDLGDYIDFLDAFINKLEIKPDVIVGHSFGGRIIIKGIASGKLKAKKIVLISAAGVKVDTLRKKLFLFLAKIGDVISYIPPLIFVRRKLKNKFYKIIGSDYLESGNMKEIFKAVVDENLAPLAAKIKCDALLIWGEKDMQTPLKDGQLLHSLIASSRLEVLQNTGHFVQIEEAQKVAGIIGDFVK